MSTQAQRIQCRFRANRDNPAYIQVGCMFLLRGEASAGHRTTEWWLRHVGSVPSSLVHEAYT